MPFGSQMIGRVHPQVQILFGTLIFSVLLVVCSFLAPIPSNFLVFTALYGSGFGLTNGFLYIVALHHSFSTYPTKPALTSGLVISGFSLGALIYTKVANVVVNPSNLPISPQEAVAIRELSLTTFPLMLRIVAMALGLQGILASFMIRDKTDVEEEKNDN